MRSLSRSEDEVTNVRDGVRVVELRHHSCAVGESDLYGGGGLRVVHKEFCSQVKGTKSILFRNFVF